MQPQIQTQNEIHYVKPRKDMTFNELRKDISTPISEYREIFKKIPAYRHPYRDQDYLLRNLGSSLQYVYAVYVEYFFDLKYDHSKELRFFVIKDNTFFDMTQFVSIAFQLPYNKSSRSIISAKKDSSNNNKWCYLDRDEVFNSLNKICNKEFEYKKMY